MAFPSVVFCLLSGFNAWLPDWLGDLFFNLVSFEVLLQLFASLSGAFKSFGQLSVCFFIKLSSFLRILPSWLPWTFFSFTFSLSCTFSLRLFTLILVTSFPPARESGLPLCLVTSVVFEKEIFLFLEEWNLANCPAFARRFDFSVFLVFSKLFLMPYLTLPCIWARSLDPSFFLLCLIIRCFNSSVSEVCELCVS